MLTVNQLLQAGGAAEWREGVRRSGWGCRRTRFRSLIDIGVFPRRRRRCWKARAGGRPVVDGGRASRRRPRRWRCPCPRGRTVSTPGRILTVDCRRLREVARAVVERLAEPAVLASVFAERSSASTGSCVQNTTHAPNRIRIPHMNRGVTLTARHIAYAYSKIRRRKSFEWGLRRSGKMGTVSSMALCRKIWSQGQSGQAIKLFQARHASKN